MNPDRYARADRDEGHYVNLAGEQYIGFVSKQLACELLDEMAENDATSADLVGRAEMEAASYKRYSEEAADALLWFSAVLGKESMKNAPEYVQEAAYRAETEHQQWLHKDFLERRQAGETNDDDEELYPEDFNTERDDENF